MDIDPRQMFGEAVDIMNTGKNGSGILGEFKASCNNKLVAASTFDYIENMTIEEFKEKELPNLYTNTGADSKFYRYVIRDMSKNTVYALTPDGVTKIHIVDHYDCDLNTFLTKLNEVKQDVTASESHILNSPVPVFGYSDGDARSCTIKLPPTTFMFRHTFGWDCKITLPPVLYKVQFAGESIRQPWVWVISKDSIKADEVEAGHLPLPNIWDDGHICVGDTKFTNPVNSAFNMFDMAYKSWQLFTGSLWNTDLLRESYFPSNLNEVYAEYKNKPAGNFNVTEGRDVEVCLKKLLTVLHDPSGYAKLDWIKCELH